MIDRRAFLRRLGFGTVAAAAAATGVVDLERLLWVPGEKTIFVPDVVPVSVYETFNVGDVITIAGRYAINPVTRQPTELLKKFVVTERVESGGLLFETAIYPPVCRTGPYANTWCPPVNGHYINGRQVKAIL